MSELSLQKAKTDRKDAARITSKTQNPRAKHSPRREAMIQLMGNQAMQRMLLKGVQAKLKVSQPGDQYEQEADRVAEMVMRMPDKEITGFSSCTGGLQRNHSSSSINRSSCPKCYEDEKLHRKALSPTVVLLAERTSRRSPESNASPEVTPEIESQINSLQGTGQPLPQSVRSFFEPRFGYDFNKVRLHTDPIASKSAEAIGARAFTIDKDIAFGVGQYLPESFEGKRLLAHELVHIIQQKSSLRSTHSLQYPRNTNNIQRSPIRGNVRGRGNKEENKNLDDIENILLYIPEVAKRLGSYNKRISDDLDFLKYYWCDNNARSERISLAFYFGLSQNIADHDLWKTRILGFATGVAIGTMFALNPPVAGTVLSVMAKSIIDTVLSEGLEATTGAAFDLYFSTVVREVRTPSIELKNIIDMVDIFHKWLDSKQIQLTILSSNAGVLSTKIGKHEISRNDASQLLQCLKRINDELKKYPKLITNAEIDLSLFTDTYRRNEKRYSDEELLRKIAIFWISELDMNNKADRDALEKGEGYLKKIKVLGDGSVLGVDFGYWTSDEDLREAIEKAKEISDKDLRMMNEIAFKYREIRDLSYNFVESWPIREFKDFCKLPNKGK